MPFDLSPWGFVRPAIHCNVVIFKFVSKKSVTSCLPELRCLFLFQGKKREWKRETRRPWLALRSLPVPRALPLAGGGCRRAGRDSCGLQSQSCRTLPGTAGWALGTRSGELLSSRAVKSRRVPAPRAELLQLWDPLRCGRSREHLCKRRPHREKDLQSIGSDLRFPAFRKDTQS